MIAVRLSGGLGNQLFQYAAARCLADLHQTDLVLDLHWFSHIPPGATARAFELDKFPVRARRFRGTEVLWAKLHQGRIIRKIPAIPRRWTHFRERHFQWDAQFAGLPDGTYLDGYWQSEKYFAQSAQAIAQDLSVQAPLQGEDQAVASRIAACNAVSVHVRRGDFVHSPSGAALHAQCSLAYYQAAIGRISQQVQAPSFFVFSDDPDWTRQHLQLPGPTEFVVHNAAATAYQDLRLMALCQHQIIANSSFSWWGAWLNRNPTKRVLAPQAWFNDATDTRDLIPADWVRL